MVKIADVEMNEAEEAVMLRDHLEQAAELLFSCGRILYDHNTGGTVKGGNSTRRAICEYLPKLKEVITQERWDVLERGWRGL